MIDVVTGPEGGETRWNRDSHAESPGGDERPLQGAPGRDLGELQRSTGGRRDPRGHRHWRGPRLLRRPRSEGARPEDTGGPAALQESDAIAAIKAFEGPVVGAVNGHAITGGFELALACDVLIASTEARFSDTHVRVGVLPGWGLSQKLPRLIGISRAKELSLTGNPIGAEQALAWGLVNRVVAPEELLPACRALAADMCSCDQKALRGYKKLIDEGYGMSFSDAMNHEAEAAIRFAADVTAGEIEARREGVIERGRERSGS